MDETGGYHVWDENGGASMPENAYDIASECPD